MALTVNWGTGLITCPISDLTLISGTRYQITVQKLWELLRDRSDDEDALPFPILYSNIPPTSSTPRIIEINEDYYTFQFENGAYSVDVVSGNTNLRDVEVKNTVSVGTNNATGAFNQGSFWNYDISAINTSGTAGKKLNDASAAGNPWESDMASNNTPGTFGAFIQKLLTVGKFIGLK